MHDLLPLQVDQVLTRALGQTVGSELRPHRVWVREFAPVQPEEELSANNTLLLYPEVQLTLQKRSKLAGNRADVPLKE